MYIESILTDMKLIHTKIDDDLANLLSKYPNQSEIVRQSLKLYIYGIHTDTLEGMRATYQAIRNLLLDIDKKADYIASKTQDIEGKLR